MLEYVNSIFVRFAWETGILGSIKEYQEYWIPTLILLGIISCFFGFKTYRFFFPLISFMFIAILSIYFMNEITDWGTVVTTFAVIGSIVAFLSYSWIYLGATVINVLVGLGLMSIISQSLGFAILVFFITTFLTISFPVIVTSILTSSFGGVLLGEIFNINTSIVIIIILLGILFQLVTNKNQEVFEKEYPDKIKYYLGKKRKGA